MRRSTSILIGFAALETIVIGGIAALIAELGSAPAEDPQARADMLRIVGGLGGGLAVLIAVILVWGFLHHRRAEKRWGETGLPPPAPLPETASCILRLTRSLRRAGLRGGPVTGEWASGGLAMTGAEEGMTRIDSAMVERIRCGYVEGKYGRFYETRVWLLGERRPIKIEPQKPDVVPYGTVMRLFARTVAAQRGIAALERGTTAAGAIVTFGLLLIPVAAYTTIALTIGEAREWNGWAAGTAVFWLFGLIAFLFYRRQRPRPLADLDELEPYLPPPVRVG